MKLKYQYDEVLITVSLEEGNYLFHITIINRSRKYFISCTIIRMISLFTDHKLRGQMFYQQVFLHDRPVCSMHIRRCHYGPGVYLIKKKIYVFRKPKINCYFASLTNNVSLLEFHTRARRYFSYSNSLNKND